MLPKERRDRGQNDFFRALLDQILDLNHALAKLAWQASIHMLGIKCVFIDVLSEFGKGGSASLQPNEKVDEVSFCISAVRTASPIPVTDRIFQHVADPDLKGEIILDLAPDIFVLGVLAHVFEFFDRADGLIAPCAE